MRRKISNLIYIIIGCCICTGLLYVLFFYYVDFNVEHKLIYQYQGDKTYHNIHVDPIGIDLFYEEKPQYKKVLAPLVDNLNRENYYLLIVYGGEIQRYTTVYLE